MARTGLVRLAGGAVVVATIAAATLGVASAQTASDGGVHDPAIRALDDLGVFAGIECNPAEGGDCLGEPMMRWTVAVWLVRVLDGEEPPVPESIRFADVAADEWWAPHVERLAELGVTKGCRPEPSHFCPHSPVTRAQVASFLARAFELAPSGPFGFTDTGGNVHKAAINSLAAARITHGCDAWPLRFCPRDPVRPGQMASFLARALDLVPRPEAVASRYDGWVDPESSGKPWGDAVEGLLTFRGNPTRSYYGRGPVPEDPRVVWRFPDGGPMCSNSPVGGNPRIWCGSGWTGQPSVFERAGSTWLVVGAFSRNVHFLDADTGKRLLPDFRTGDIIKGSVTIDPDGYPLVYTGSRDNKYRIIAFDGEEPRELWSLDAYEAGPIQWNDDWDSAGMVIDNHLLLGGENSRFYVVRLDRGFDADGRVTVDPRVVFQTPAWDDELLAAVGRELSIENSVAVSGDTVYFANSGGLIQGWDLSGLTDDPDAVPERVFHYWAGDDVDGSLVIDTEGMIYAGIEYQRGTARSREVGQIIKLDPTKPDDPLVWSVHARGALNASGVWATPGLHRDILIVPTHTGHIYGIDTATGEVRWVKKLSGPVWPSPVVVDDVWIQGACNGWLYGFDVSDTTVEPPQLWRVNLGACIESTPAVWDGLIAVGTKGGWIYGLR